MTVIIESGRLVRDLVVLAIGVRIADKTLEKVGKAYGKAKSAVNKKGGAK